MFTINQIEEIRKIIEYQHTVFIATNIGVELLSDYDKYILQSYGFDLTTIDKLTPYYEMFRWGMLSSSLGYKEANKLDYNQYISFLRSGNYLPLSEIEQYALNIARNQAYNDIKGLGNKISKDTNQLLINYSHIKRENYKTIIKDTVAENIKNRGNVSNLVSELGHKTKDWSRDFGRIAEYTMHQAFEEGRATQIINQYGNDANVYKSVFEKACKHCIKLYLTNGIGSEPKIFKLSELIANGTNIGRKTDEWLPIVGPTHPWCRCTISQVDMNYSWDSKSQSFNIPKEYKRKIQRNSSVNITIGSTSYNV